jgi:hypothetical protein
MSEDEYQARFAKLRTKWGLHAAAGPAEIAVAEKRQEALVQSYLASTGTADFIAKVRQLGVALGVDPDPEGIGGAHWPTVWAAVRDQDHPLCRLSRAADGVHWIMPTVLVPDPRISKLAALAADPAATTGEAEAARAAIGRITAGAPA